MRKIAMIVSMLAVLGTSAQAGTWMHTPYSNSSTNWTTQWNSVYVY